MSNADPASSNIANAFGARIEVASPGRGMYLVIGRGGSPAALVRSAGGRLILRLSDNKLLVRLPTEKFLALQRHPAIALIGPVEIDQQRFARFAASLNLNSNTLEG